PAPRIDWKRAQRNLSGQLQKRITSRKCRHHLKLFPRQPEPPLLVRRLTSPLPGLASHRSTSCVSGALASSKMPERLLVSFATRSAHLPLGAGTLIFVPSAANCINCERVPHAFPPIRA